MLHQQLVFIRFLSILLLLLVILPVIHSQSLLRGNNNSEPNLQDDNDDDKYDKGPKAISDVVLSAVKTGRMDQTAYETALQSGFTQNQIDRIVQLASEKVRQDGNTNQIEADLSKLSALKVPPRKLRTPRNTYVKGKPWTLSYYQQRLVSKAVLTAIYSKTKQVDEAAVQTAMEAGVDRELIMKAVKAATQHRSKSSSSSSTGDSTTIGASKTTGESTTTGASTTTGETVLAEQ